MIDGVLVPRGVLLAAARSVEAVEGRIVLGGGTCAGAGREHLRDDERARTASGWSGGSADRLLDGRVDVDGRKRVLAELAQDVVGAAAELTRDRERGAFVVSPFAHMQEVGWSGEARRRACAASGRPGPLGGAAARSGAAARRGAALVDERLARAHPRPELEDVRRRNPRLRQLAGQEQLQQEVVVAPVGLRPPLVPPPGRRLGRVGEMDDVPEGGGFGAFPFEFGRPPEPEVM